MPIYDYACPDGHRFELLVPAGDDADRACPVCAGRAVRKPCAARLAGHADPGPGRDDAPVTWRGTGNGDRDTVRYWHEKMTARERLEQRYPELAGDRRPVLAHEGRFAANPLRAGDPLPPVPQQPSPPAAEKQD